MGDGAAPKSEGPPLFTVDGAGGGMTMSSMILLSPARSKYFFGVLNVSKIESKNLFLARSRTSATRVCNESRSRNAGKNSKSESDFRSMAPPLLMIVFISLSVSMGRDSNCCLNISLPQVSPNFSNTARTSGMSSGAGAGSSRARFPIFEDEALQCGE